MRVVGSWTCCLQAGVTAWSASTGFSSSSWGNVVLVALCVKKTLITDILSCSSSWSSYWLCQDELCWFFTVSCDFVKMGFVLPCIL
jgi:hypothetical protein